MLGLGPLSQEEGVIPGSRFLLGCLPAVMAKSLNLLDLLGFMQKPRSRNTLRLVVGLSGICLSQQK